MPAFTPIPSGTRFGRLTVTRDRQRGERRIECVCDCGKRRQVLRNEWGKSQSCGSCGRLGSRNGRWSGGKTSHPLYDVYMDMIARCHRSTHPRYADYGGRGITVCERWRGDFWAYVGDVGERPAGMTLDRVDNDDGYHPGNWRWATYSDQNQNRRQSAYSGLRNRPRRTRCRADKHDMTPENTRASGGCRECWNIRRRARRAGGSS